MTAVLVTGGTGTLGREVVRHLTAGGHGVTVTSRRRPSPGETSAPATVTVDYGTGAGLDDAIGAADAVVHCATSFRREVDLTRAVLASARRRSCRHLVYVSIVGVDRLPLPYYRSKYESERLIAESGIPWTVLRATQFHPLVFALLSTLARAPVLPVPHGVRVQPIHVPEVAAALADLATGPPQGRVPDLGGPEVRDVAEYARAVLRATGRRRRLLPVRLPGKVFRGYRDGLHLAPDRAVGRVTFEQYLRQR